MKNDLNIYQDDIRKLSSLHEYSFENVFKVYSEDGFYAYNIIKTVKFPAELDTDVFDNVQLSGELPWTLISQKLYGTIRLWWLLCVVNKIMNPVSVPVDGTIIKVIKPSYVQTVIDQIRLQR